MDMTAILEVRDVHVSYGKVEALHGVSLQVGAGRIVSVIGPNGAGKSTLLNAVMGTLPGGGAARGSLRFMGEELRGMPVEQRVMRGMSLVPETRELFSSMSVEDNLQLGAYPRKQAGERLYMDQLPEVYRLFPRLQERAKQWAGTLSGGERQMLALGRALMAKPRLLMLDEPSLGLAPLIVQEILGFVRRLRDEGVSVLLVEQNARAALDSSDHGYVLETGEIALSGASSELAGDPRVQATYLGGATDED
jgi:branched-chain amino acid transport system ATP-binding protein